MLLYCPTVKLSYSNVGNLCWQRFFPQPATTLKNGNFIYFLVILVQFAGRLYFFETFSDETSLDDHICFVEELKKYTQFFIKTEYLARNIII